MPKVSVVIPVHNAESYLKECLDSVESQTHADVEIICVDDGSTDASGRILSEYSGKDSRFTVIRQSNRGPSVARNVGLDAASGEYVLFLDSDDTFERCMIEQVYARCIADDADVAVFKARYLYSDTGKSVVADWSLRANMIPAETPFSRRDMSSNIFLFTTPVVWNKMFKRSFLAEEGLRFPHEVWGIEDLPFTYLALAKAKRISVVDKALVNYRAGIAGSLQGTTHERPAEICKALRVVKHEATEAGIFDEIERDFVNAALYQCLYNLENMRTATASRELYELLRSDCFSELGISGRSPDYFQVDRNYRQYSKIMELAWEDFTLAEVASLRSELREAQERLNRDRAELRAAHEQLEQLHEKADSDEASMIAMQSSLAMAAAKEAERASELTRVQRRLDETLAQLDDMMAALKQATTRLQLLEASYSYRIGLLATAIPRKIRHWFPVRRKAK